MPALRWSAWVPLWNIDYCQAVTHRVGMSAWAVAASVIGSSLLEMWCRDKLMIPQTHWRWAGDTKLCQRLAVIAVTNCSICHRGGERQLLQVRRSKCQTWFYHNLSDNSKSPHRQPTCFSRLSVTRFNILPPHVSTPNLCPSFSRQHRLQISVSPRPSWIPALTAGTGQLDRRAPRPLVIARL